MTSCMWSHVLHEDVSVYAKPVFMLQLDTIYFIRQYSQAPNSKDKADILTLCEVIFKCYANHSKQIPDIWVSAGFMQLVLHLYNISASAKTSAWTHKALQAWYICFHTATIVQQFVCPCTEQAKWHDGSLYTALSYHLYRVASDVYLSYNMKWTAKHVSVVTCFIPQHGSLNSFNALHPTSSLRSTIATILIISIPTRWAQLYTVWHLTKTGGA